jgi:integrase
MSNPSRALIVIPKGRPEPKRFTLPPPSPEMTLLDFFQRCYLLERELAPNSIYQFKRSIRQLQEFAGCELRLCDLSKELLNVWIIYRTKAASARTAHKNRGDLLCLWRLAYEHELIEFLPRGVRRVKYTRRVPRAWTAEQFRTVLAAAEKLSGVYVFNPELPFKQGALARSLWWSAFIRTAYDTGLRRGDLLMLQRGQIGDDGKLIVYIGKTRMEHCCQVRPETLAAIDATYPPVRERIFEFPKSYKCLWKHWEQILGIAGLPCNRENGIHCLRRTSASHLERIAPKTSGRHLGHLTPGMAEAHYIDPRIAGEGRPMLPPDLTEDGEEVRDAS